MASFWPTTRCASRSSIFTSFSRSPSSIRHTGMCVHDATTLAMSSSVTSWRSNVGRASCPTLPAGGTPAARSNAASFFSKSGILPYWISEALLKSPRRWTCSSSIFACSSCVCTTLTALTAAFSFCHCAVSALDFSFKLASSLRQALEPFLARRVLFLGQRRALDLQL